MDGALVLAAKVLVGLSLPWAMMYAAVYLFRLMAGSHLPGWAAVGPISAVGLALCLLQCVAVAWFFRQRPVSRPMAAACAAALAALNLLTPAAFGRPIDAVEVGNVAFLLLLGAVLLTPAVGRHLAPKPTRQG